MAKQKVVFGLPMEDAKIRTKALQCIAKFPGVRLMSIAGNQLKVEGEGIDPVLMTLKLRKKIRSTQIQTVETDEGKKQVKKDETKKVVVDHIAPPPVLYYVETPIHENYCHIW
ncbi:hypothetical protein HPP92_027529 [Vanilla planifolia]|uniref:HMA domain-containing protein n=1 Tax=Vanilla planifolia TaxID=51239 RepID=A0A835P8Q5_VANPL|nr:hypothetical protein HPP92_027529 [Vanilla planifolia]KAG0498330.1 hypothetical protein HPP92_003021 [Vanilla planifolia]